jgi:glutamate-1-semialdehyde 2,1-aminomutase
VVIPSSAQPPEAAEGIDKSRGEAPERLQTPGLTWSAGAPGQGTCPAAPRPQLEAYRATTAHSRALYERACRVLPGGVAKGASFHPPYPMFLASGSGPYVTTVDGQRLLDLRGHHTATILGHGDPAVEAAVRAQLARGIALGGPTEVEHDLAAELVRRVPSVERVRFTTSGSEAINHILRLARGVTGRAKIAKFEGGYHGSVDAVDVSLGPPPELAGPPEAPLPVPNTRGLARGAAEDTVILPYRNPRAVTEILRRHRSELAAVLLDPRAGILPIDSEFVRFVRRITDELGLLLVLDEVVSFRLGPAGLQGLTGIRPDLTAFGKIIGGGFPLGAFGGRADLMVLLDESDGPTGFSQSGTFSGHPVALAAGLAVLRALTPSAFGHLDTLGETVRRECNAIFARRGIEAQAVGDGSLFSVHFTAAPLRDYRSLQTADAALARDVFLGLLVRDVLPAVNLSMCAVSLPMGRAHLDALFDALDRTLAALR